MTDAEWEEWHYDMLCQQRRHGFSMDWRYDAYRGQIQQLSRLNEALIAERDALRMALLGLGGTPELRAIYKDGIAT